MRIVNRKGVLFSSFSPAISKYAEDRIRREITSWRLRLRNSQTIAELARKINPKLRGWINYYGRFNPTALHPIERHLGLTLARWARRKYQTLRRHRLRSWKWVERLTQRQPISSPSRSTNAGRFSPREPYEWRRSRTVLGEPRGATPRGHLTVHVRLAKAFNLHSYGAKITWEFGWERWGVKLRPVLRPASLVQMIWELFAHDAAQSCWRRCPHCQRLFYPKRRDQCYRSPRQQAFASEREWLPGPYDLRTLTFQFQMSLQARITSSKP